MSKISNLPSPKNPSSTDGNMDASRPGSKTSIVRTGPPPVNEEGDASHIAKKEAPPSQEPESPFNKQRLGAYKHFARAANRTLTTFTNEMSEILRQSIERLDTISMKVRGCVYEIERQRVAIPILMEIPECNSGDQSIVKSEEKIEECLECEEVKSTEEKPVPEQLPMEITANLISDIKEIAVKCKKTPSTEKIKVEKYDKLDRQEKLEKQENKEWLEKQKALLEQQAEDHSVVLNLENDKLQINVLKHNINTKKGRATPRSHSKKNTTDTSSVNVNEKEVLSNMKITKTKRVKRRAITPRSTPRTLKAASQSSDNDQAGPPPRKPVKRRLPRKREAGSGSKTGPSQKRARHSKKVNDVYTKGNYNAASWFGPKICAVNNLPSAKKSLKSIKSVRLTQAKDSNTNSLSTGKLEVRNTKLARKFASSNFHDIQETSKVESYTGGRLVKLTSASRQDWSVIMHTQKAPTRYDLRQNAPLPTNNILDEITLKDLEPLKAEYPRRDNIVGNSQRLEDTLLYKLVNGNPASIETLINVTSAARYVAPSKSRLQVHNQSTPTPTSRVASRRHIPIVTQLYTPSQMENIPPPVQVTPLSGRIAPTIPPTPTAQLLARSRGNSAMPISSSLSQAKGDNLSRAGIYRCQDMKNTKVTILPKKALNPKESVIEHSKKIVAKLSEIKTDRNLVSAKPSVTVQNPLIFKQDTNKDARKRLKKYLENPEKTHQKYMVMMVNEITYDNYTLKDGIMVPKMSVKDFLAKYIYLDKDRANMSLVPPKEYTVAIMTASTGFDANPIGTPQQTLTVKRRTYMQPNRDMNIRPTRDRERLFPRRPVLPPLSPPHSPNNIAEATWKNVVRSCYNSNSGHSTKQPTPAKKSSADIVETSGLAMPTMGKYLNPVEVRHMISQMEAQLKQVVANPLIENKETVIKGLQEQMETVLSTLEGHTNVLRRKKESRIKPEKLTNFTSMVTRPEIRKREPILKPIEGNPRFSTSAAAAPSTRPTHPHLLKEEEVTVVEPALPKDSFSDVKSELKKAQAHTTIVSNLDIDRECQASTVTDEMQNKLMNKWQALEHPSQESMDMAGIDDFPRTSTQSQSQSMQSVERVVQAKKIKSRPETRREGRHDGPMIKGSATNVESLHRSQERYQSRCGGALNQDGSKNTANTEKLLDEILAKIELEETEEEDSTADGKNENDDDIEMNSSSYDSCIEAELPIKEIKENHGTLTPKKIHDYQESIKMLEIKLGEETQKFVDEMDEVIKQIEEKSKHSSESDLEVDNRIETGPSNEAIMEEVQVIPQKETETVNCKPEKEDTKIQYHSKSESIIMINSTEDVATLAKTNNNLDLDCTDRGTNIQNIHKPTIPITPREISFTLNYDMGRHGRQKDVKSTPCTPRKKKPERDYDLKSPRSKESEMIQDIRKTLFGPPTTTHDKMVSPIEKKAKMMQTNAVARFYNHMPSWETSDKSTTVSMTNLDDFWCTKTDSSVNPVGPRRSKSEINVSKSDISKLSVKRTVQIVESGISATMRRFFHDAGLSTMSENVDNILQATLKATLAHQQKLNNNIKKSKRCEVRCVRKFEGLLTAFYSLMFTIMWMGLNWCPTCVA